MTRFSRGILVAACAMAMAHALADGQYGATWESLDSRPVPGWWQDAKFGIFIFWGPYSVPAYAPLDSKDIYACYAEWYQGRMLQKKKKQEPNPFREHNIKHYADMPYANFAAQFTARFFEPAKWAEMFKKAGAKYVVLASKHHDGYALWPSPESPYFNSVAVGSGRDLAGELSRAVKAAGLKSGFYYSLIEYANPYSPNVEKRYKVKAAKGADARKWARAMNVPQMKELVEDYSADILYTDGDWEATDDEFCSREFLQWLFNESTMKDSIVVNDRWGIKCRGRHGGYYTTEYGFREGHEKAGEIIHPWEECRGLGRSFGYNRFETARQYASAEDCIRTLVDIVSRGGNLLLDVGPDADGRIPPIMEDRLLQIGEWLAVNGEAIYGTRARSVGPKSDGGKTFFTEKGDALYAIVTERPCGEVRVKGVEAAKDVALLGEDMRVEWRVDSGDLVVTVPAAMPLKGRHAWAFKISGTVPSKPRAQAVSAKPALSRKRVAEGDDVLAHVDPFIGTEGKGNTLPGPTAPFALIQPGPDSGSVDIAGGKNPRYCNGYKRDDDRIIGFTQTHLSGTGCPDLCDFLLLPFTGDEPAWGLKDRETETSRPGYYSVHFTNTLVRTEITATRRCGVYRMTWAANARPRLLVDLQHGNVATYSKMSNSNHVLASSSRIDRARNRLYVDNHVQAWLQNRHVSGVFAFSRPIASVAELPPEPGNRAKRYILDFAASAEPLEIKVSISGVDSAGAERNLDAELGADSAFERVRKETEDAWRALLGRVRAKAPPDTLKLVYTALYHCFQQPNLFSDVDGRYRNAAAEIDRTDGEYYTGFSLWDTFRAVHPLYTILAPEKVDAFVRSFLAQYRCVGYLPVIPYFGRETFCMIGVHSIPVITDAYLKGFRGFDAEEALTAVTNALTVTHRSRPRAEWWVPDEDWELLDRFGYYPWDFTYNQGVSRTLEIAYNEACAATLARALGKKDVAEMFAARSQRWTNHFDRATLLMRGRGANGTWREPFDPTKRTYCTQRGGDYTESNAREYTWFVPHDPTGLIEAFGGKDMFVRELSDFFWKHREYRHDNEPGHQAPYQFAFAGRPDLTARIVRETIRNSYFATSHAMRGNDDCGQMSAWYLFSTFGFYPFDGFSATYVLGAPQIEEATLELPNGRCLHITAPGLSEEAMYVARVELNGKVLKGPTVSHAELMRGGELVFHMTDKAR